MLLSKSASSGGDSTLQYSLSLMYCIKHVVAAEGRKLLSTDLNLYTNFMSFCVRFERSYKMTLFDLNKMPEEQEEMLEEELEYEMPDEEEKVTSPIRLSNALNGAQNIPLPAGPWRNDLSPWKVASLYNRVQPPCHIMGPVHVDNSSRGSGTNGGTGDLSAWEIHRNSVREGKRPMVSSLTSKVNLVQPTCMSLMFFTL